jgi:hypothetical protein
VTKETAEPKETVASAERREKKASVDNVVVKETVARKAIKAIVEPRVTAARKAIVVVRAAEVIVDIAANVDIRATAVPKVSAARREIKESVEVSSITLTSTTSVLKSFPSKPMSCLTATVSSLPDLLTLLEPLR